MTQAISRDQYKALQAKPTKKNKFNAQRCEMDSIHFDSKAERDYYAVLKLRERAGEICDVQMQQPYDLTVNGFLVATYKADFTYWDNKTQCRHVIDVKGFITPVFKLKQKLMRACHGIEIEVCK